MSLCTTEETRILQILVGSGVDFVERYRNLFIQYMVDYR